MKLSEAGIEISASGGSDPQFISPDQLSSQNKKSPTMKLSQIGEGSQSSIKLPENEDNSYEEKLNARKKELEDQQKAAYAKEAEIKQREQQKQAIENDPKNWSSDRIQKETPKPRTFQEKAQKDAAVSFRKEQEHEISDKILGKNQPQIGPPTPGARPASPKEEEKARVESEAAYIKKHPGEQDVFEAFQLGLVPYSTQGQEHIKVMEKAHPIAKSVGQMTGMALSMLATAPVEGVVQAQPTIRALKAVSSPALKEVARYGARAIPRAIHFAASGFTKSVLDNSVLLAQGGRTIAEAVKDIAQTTADMAVFALPQSLANPLARIPATGAEQYVSSLMQGHDQISSLASGVLGIALGLLDRSNFSVEEKALAFRKTIGEIHKKIVEKTAAESEVLNQKATVILGDASRDSLRARIKKLADEGRIVNVDPEEIDKVVDQVLNVWGRELSAAKTQKRGPRLLDLPEMLGAQESGYFTGGKLQSEAEGLSGKPKSKNAPKSSKTEGGASSFVPDEKPPVKAVEVAKTPTQKPFKALVEAAGGDFVGFTPGFTKKDGVIVPGLVQFRAPGGTTLALPEDKFTSVNVKSKLQGSKKTIKLSEVEKKPEVVKQKKPIKYNIDRAVELGDRATLVKAMGGLSRQDPELKGLEPEEVKKLFPFFRKSGSHSDTLLSSLQESYPALFGTYKDGPALIRAMIDGDLYKKDERAAIEGEGSSGEVREQGDLFGEKPTHKKRVFGEARALKPQAETPTDLEKAGMDEKQLQMFPSETEVAHGSPEAKEESVKKSIDSIKKAVVKVGDKFKSVYNSPFAVKFKELGKLSFPGTKWGGDPASLAFAFKFMHDETLENFYIGFMKEGMVQAVEWHSMGTVNEAAVHPYEMLGLGSHLGSDMFFLVHNHPSGKVEPSREDQEITQKIKSVLEPQKIKFVGHIIMEGDHFGFMEDTGFSQIQHKEYAETRDVSVLKKYREWSSGEKTIIPGVGEHVRSPQAMFDLAKGIQTGKNEGMLVLMDTGLKILNVLVFPKGSVTGQEALKLAVTARASSIATVNSGLNISEVGDIKKELSKVGVRYFDDVKEINENSYESMSERGAMDSGEKYGVKEKTGEEGFLKPEMILGVPEAADAMKKASVFLQKVTTLDPWEDFTRTQLQTLLGEKFREVEKLRVGLEKAKKTFDKMTNDQILEFWDRHEHGLKQPEKWMQDVSDVFKVENMKRATILKKLGILEQTEDDWLGRRRKETDEDSEEAIRAMKAKRPFAGSEAFRKSRKFKYMKDFVAAGNEPVTWNPVEMFILKTEEMEKSIMFHQYKDIARPAGGMQFQAIHNEMPEGWIRINDKSMTVYGPPSIQIKEAVDTAVMTGLEKVADALGISRERRARVGGQRLGYAQSGPIDPKTGMPGPGKVVTKFATPEEVLAHEIAHQIDFMYGIRKMMFGDFGKPMADFIYDAMIKKAEGEGRYTDIEKLKKQKVINKELRALGEATQGPKAWRKKSAERIAVLVESLIHAPEELKRIAPTAHKMIYDIVSHDPRLKPLLDIKPDIVRPTVRTTEIPIGGMTILGHWIVPEGSGKVINNYLQPGLSGHALFDAWRGLANSMNMARFGISAFHVGVTGLYSAASRLGAGLEALYHGDLFKAAGKILTSPVAQIPTLIKGHKLMNAYYGKPSDPVSLAIADILAKGGGRPKASVEYRMQAAKQMRDAFREGKLLTGVLQIPYMLMEKFAFPVMDWWVPHIKMGVFFEGMQDQLDRSPNMSPEQIQKYAQYLVNHIDYVYGQMIYENRFWNKVYKDIAMSVVNCLGWQSGDVYWAGNSAKEAKNIIADLARGKRTERTKNIAFGMGLVMMVALYSAIYQKLKTGKAPEEMLDLFHPKNGKLDKEGKPQRVNFKTYILDLEGMFHDPGRTIVNKLTPQISMLVQMLNNKDFYGTEIRNIDDPVMKQVKDEIGYWVGAGYTPFSIRNIQQSKGDLEQGAGMVMAPRWLSQTPAEQRAQELMIGNMPQGSRTQKQADKSKTLSDLRNAYKQGDLKPLAEAVEQGKITLQDEEKIINLSQLDPLVRTVSGLKTVEQVLSVYKRANKLEREKILPILQKKLSNRMKKPQTETDRSEDEDLFQKYFGGRS